MSLIANLTGSRITIYDEENTQILDTTILSHNTNANIITVRKQQPIPDELKRVSLIVYLDNKKLSFKGTFSNKASSTELNIALYKESTIEDREYKRYDLNTYCSLEGILDPETKSFSKKELVLTIRNISSSGIQLLANNDSLHKGDIFKIKLIVATPIARELIAKVVRKEPFDDYKSIYGCILLSKEH